MLPFGSTAGRWTSVCGVSAASFQPPPAAAGVTAESVQAYVTEQWAATPAARCVEISGRHVLTTMPVKPESIRPGGFISGPTQFGLADLALWYAVFGAVGLEAMALTSELSIRFVRPATGPELWARADLQSVGSRNVVGTVVIWTDAQDKPTAVCQGTYVLPK